MLGMDQFIILIMQTSEIVQENLLGVDQFTVHIFKQIVIIDQISEIVQDNTEYRLVHNTSGAYILDENYPPPQKKKNLFWANLPVKCSLSVLLIMF